MKTFWRGYIKEHSLCFLIFIFVFSLLCGCSSDGDDASELSVEHWETMEETGYCSDIAGNLYLSIQIDSNGGFTGVYDAYVLGYPITVGNITIWACRLLEKPKPVSGRFDNQKFEGYIEGEGIERITFTFTKTDSSIWITFPKDWTWSNASVTKITL